ncbi:hypothetical protein BU25DRAFT_453798 [Macroventuria anomochaeta]|uniref:Uncharacterized protein n=1 Tax=Macroventuria anomochaeta TaxID=301207 RepID=A0ACB6SEL6_9PLEO|nr:uncharacterized protein BU25DRAFT_453798 [Macroventuria anomochaeta]KAF2632591.1 hypothetical protein BU25DRAFT_453798 [Macroventuria anomochaeta]
MRLLAGFNAEFADDYNGINWDKLRSYVKPQRTLTGQGELGFQARLDKEAYNNDPKHEKDEEKSMAEWRQLGLLGVFLDVINYISTPKQYNSFSTFQQLALAEDPTNISVLLLAVVKACVTR